MSPESGRIEAISKTLSDNDAGQTRGHQAGIYIPKNLVPFFPQLQKDKLNPRVRIPFRDHEGNDWVLHFIHYNNRIEGGTRNEYRLTHVMDYIKHYGLGPGDTIELSVNDGHYEISHTKDRKEPEEGNALRLGDSWRVISF